MTLRRDILRSEVRRVTLEAAPGLTDCVWSPYTADRPARPYAEWRPITYPTSMGYTRDNIQAAEIPRQCDVTVLTAIAGESYRLGYNYASATSTSTTSVTTIRDDLLAQINADTREDIVATTIAGDGMRLEAQSPGALWYLTAVASQMTIAGVIGSPTDCVEMTRSPQRMTATLNIYADNALKATDAHSYAHQVEKAFQKSRVLEELSQAFLVVQRISEPVNLSQLTTSQAQFETRSATDYELKLPYWEADPVSSIESVEDVTITTDRGNITFSI